MNVAIGHPQQAGGPASGNLNSVAQASRSVSPAPIGVQQNGAPTETKHGLPLRFLVMVLAAAVTAPLAALVLVLLANGHAGADTAPFALPLPAMLAASLLYVPGLAVAFLVDRRIRAALQALAHVTNEATEPDAAVPHSGVREIDKALEALTASLRKREEAAAALAATNASLEARLAQSIAECQTTSERSSHAERMEALGSLASGVVHDFGNVLQVMEGAVNEILEDARHELLVMKSAKLMQDVIQNARGGVRRLLSFARHDVPQTIDCDVRSTLGAVREILLRALPRSVTLTLDVANGLPRMHADAGRLEAVLLNLATNAHHAMRGGGTLMISARLHLQNGDEPGGAALRRGAYIRLDTTDTGSGMHQTTLARASEPFFTTKPTGQGTGLGLSAARGFAEQSGGSFAIASKLGQGTTVTLWLPCAAEQVVAPSRPLDVGRNEAPHILLLDDEAAIRDVMARQLRKRGFQVDVCEDAGQALSAIARQEPIDLLLTDFAMPDLACDVLIARVHATRPDLPVIVLTGYPLDANALVDAYAGTGLLELLCKPISARELELAIKQMLEGRQSRAQLGSAASLH